MALPLMAILDGDGNSHSAVSAGLSPAIPLDRNVFAMVLVMHITYTGYLEPIQSGDTSLNMLHLKTYT